MLCFQGMVALPTNRCGSVSTLRPAQDMVPSSPHTDGERKKWNRADVRVLDSSLKGNLCESISLTVKHQKHFILFLLLLFFLLSYNSHTRQLIDISFF